jgi:hypothetical protein
MNKSIFKSIGAIIAGLLAIVVLSIATDILVEQLGLVPPANKGTFSTNMFIIALIYRSIYAISGGYLTAKLSPQKPLKHSSILGIIGFVLSLLGTIAMWDKGSHWYSILLTITAFPTTWFGGKLFLKNKQNDQENK